ncbi:MAG: EAL domain-containing protein [Deltaproteobacteria bacterium]|nr:EAL domain-containing protein [Deltaproteobacteria bacterium]
MIEPDSEPLEPDLLPTDKDRSPLGVDGPADISTKSMKPPSEQSEQETVEIQLTGPASGSPSGSGAPALHIRSDGLIDEVSDEVAELFGMGPLTGQHFVDIVDEEEQESLERLLRLVLEMRREGLAEFSIYHPERGTQRFSAEAYPTSGADGVGVLLEITDITDKSEARKRIESMIPWVRAITRDSDEVILLVGPEVGEHLVSGSTRTVLGIDEKQFSLLHLRNAIHPEDQMRTMLAFEEVKENPGNVARLKFRTDDGADGWLHIEAQVSNRTTDPDVRGVVYMLRDVTERTIRDPVTGLPNRVLLLDRVEQLIAARAKSSYALLIIGLDRLPFVRGTLGPAAADAMVSVFGERLLGLVEAGWTVARTGEAELALLATGLHSNQEVRGLVERIGKLSEQSFNLAKQELVSSLTIGIALSTRGYLVGRSMLHDAQTAFERAREKAATGGRQVANTQVLNQNVDRVQIETELYRALSEGELRLNYQPIVTLQDGKLRGFEALVRWKHPERGLFGPERFLSVAEESGQIVALGAWVIDRACARLKRWEKYTGFAADLQMAVNVSARQLGDVGIVGAVEQALLTHRIQPGRLKLEVTETALIQNPEAAAATLRRVRQLGVEVALDDFGTGYCSLAYLTKFPVDALKIDREFVSGTEGILTSERGEPLARAIVDLARSLKLDVVAEGIETQEQAAALTSLGCKYGQGYYFGRPLGPRLARDLIARQDG